MSDKRSEWIVLGRVIGTGIGWDSMDESTFCIYQFEPVADINLPVTDCLSVDTHYGYFEWDGDEGKPVKADIVSVLHHLQRPPSP